MKTLVIGGTQFVGRHIVTALLADGDDVTLFHRGLTNPGLFPDAEHRLGDRNNDLGALASGRWDATIDTSAYVPRQVRSLAEVLGARGGRYVHISSVSAYADPLVAGFDEDAPLAVLDDPATEVVNEETYGGLKALCERASHEWFGGIGAGGSQSRSADGHASGVPVSIVRPTYVAGPYDHTKRFTWWVERVARGGPVLAPGPKENPLQVIDARDLAGFVVLLAHGQAAGTFHAVSPAPPFSFEDFLTTVLNEVGPSGTELIWVSPEALAKAHVTAAELPLWSGVGAGGDLAASPARAIAAGLRVRPLAQTVREVHEHELAEPDALTARAPAPVGLAPAKERELLALSG
ncbi:MAG TPA: NAD-dependent epimerase/dehydratase family protein [Acidimicrobiales bacterium]|nr:NAD-dependent epimerase/dehydratase family protein [Acidimicrobiales bacterium]